MARLKHTDWPARLWIVRHGQSAGNVARDQAEQAAAHLIDLQTRDADTPLSELGHAQAAALARWFAALPRDERPTTLMSSPFVRSRQTMETVAAALGTDPDEVLVDERLREKEFGVTDGYTATGIAAKFPELAEQRARVGKFYFRAPGGESWCDVILRLRSVVEVLRRDYVGERVLIVAHQVIVNCFRYLLECMDEAEILEIDRRADVPNCAVTAYAIDRDADGSRFGLQVANLELPLDRAGVPSTGAADRPAGPR